MESSSYENWDEIEMFFGHLVISNLQLVIGNRPLAIVSGNQPLSLTNGLFLIDLNSKYQLFIANYHIPIAKY